MAAVALGFCACDETWDDNPKLKTHEGVVTAEFLNAPLMQDMPLMITEANKNGSFKLTCSQPDFGYAAAAVYKVQVSLDENFATYEELSDEFVNCANIAPLNSNVAIVLEKLSNVKTEDDLPLPYQKLYMRLRAYVPQDEANTQYLSNVVYFNAVSADYLAIWVSGVPVNMYLRGGFPTTPGWDAVEQYQFVTGPEENTWVTQTVTIPAGTEFKVADSSWGACNWGAFDGKTTITIGEPFVLNTDPADGGPKNIKLTQDFTGIVHVSFVKGTYTLILAATN